MRTRIVEENNRRVMYFEGRMDTAASLQVQDEAQPLCQSDGRDIVLDCTNMEYISSSGLRIFLGVLKSAKASGCHVYLRGLQPAVSQVFTLTGFLNLFEFE